MLTGTEQKKKAFLEKQLATPRLEFILSNGVFGMGVIFLVILIVKYIWWACDYNWMIKNLAWLIPVYAAGGIIAGFSRRITMEDELEDLQLKAKETTTGNG